MSGEDTGEGVLQWKWNVQKKNKTNHNQISCAQPGQGKERKRSRTGGHLYRGGGSPVFLGARTASVKPKAGQLDPLVTEWCLSAVYREGRGGGVRLVGGRGRLLWQVCCKYSLQRV